MSIRSMKRLVLGTITAALIAGSFPIAAPAGAASTAGTDNLNFGVQFHAMWTSYTNQERIEVLDKMAAAGIKWLRIVMGWS